MNIYDSLEILLSYNNVEITMRALASGHIEVYVVENSDLVVQKLISPDAHFKMALRRLITKALEDKRWS